MSLPKDALYYGRMTAKRSFVLLSAAAALALSACNGSSGSIPPPAFNANAGFFANSPIKHVVIMIQENRSFNNLFDNFPGATTAGATGMTQSGPIALTQTTLEAGVDMCHFHSSFEAAYDGGKLDDFSAEETCGFVHGTYGPIAVSNAMYAYVDQAEIQPYWTMAKDYTLADMMFQSNNGPSYPAHQYLIAGQSDFASEVPTSGPWGCDAPPGTTVDVMQPNGQEVVGPFPCFNYQTLGDLLDAANVSWKYYAPALNTTGGLFSAYDAIKHIRYSSDWTNKVISPETTVLSDIQNGNLPSVSWVIPSFPNSDHPLAASNTGPAWVASVVNAVGSSQYWNDTAIFIVWDDWGGWYDPVVPPQNNVMGWGFRVPMLVVSPYAKHGYVSHVQRDFGSILRFVEENFNLPSLNEDDANADNLLDCFDFTQPVAPFTPIPAAHGARYFINEVHVMGANDPD
jgi:phospholipase C